MFCDRGTLSFEAVSCGAVASGESTSHNSMDRELSPGCDLGSQFGGLLLLHFWPIEEKHVRSSVQGDVFSRYFFSL